MFFNVLNAGCFNCSLHCFNCEPEACIWDGSSLNLLNFPPKIFHTSLGNQQALEIYIYASDSFIVSYFSRFLFSLRYLLNVWAMN